MKDKKWNIEFLNADLFDDIEKGCVIRGIFLDGRDVDLV